MEKTKVKAVLSQEIIDLIEKRATATDENEIKALNATIDSLKVKPESISSINKRKFKTDKNYGIDERFNICNYGIEDNAINAVFRLKINIRICVSFLYSLSNKGNSTALDLLYGRELPFCKEDLQAVVDSTIIENADMLIYDKDLQIVDMGNCVIECFKACSREMFRHATKVLNHQSYTSIINEYLNSNNWTDGILKEDTETGETYTQDMLPLVKYDISVIEKYIQDNYKKDTADEMTALFYARLYGQKFSDFAVNSGLKIERVKYLNRLLHKVGLDLGYIVPAYNSVYTVKADKKHVIIINNKSYNVTTVKSRKKAVINKWMPTNKRYTCKPFIYNNFVFADFAKSKIKNNVIIQKDMKKCILPTEKPFKRFTVTTHKYDKIKECRVAVINDIIK